MGGRAGGFRQGGDRLHIQGLFLGAGRWANLVDKRIPLCSENLVGTSTTSVNLVVGTGLEVR